MSIADTLWPVRRHTLLILLSILPTACTDAEGGANAAPDNRAPVFATVTPRAVTTGEVFTLVVNAEDPDPGDIVTYSFASDAPAGATLNARNGLFGWTAAANLAGRFLRVTFAAEDGRGGRDELTVLLTVVGDSGDDPGDDGVDPNRPPVIEPIEDVRVAVRAPVELQVRASDPDGDVLTVSVAGRLPGGASWDSEDRRFQWVPGPVNEGQTYELFFAATDGQLTAVEDVRLAVTKSRPDQPEPDPDPPGEGEGEPAGPEDAACEDDRREAGGGDDDLEHALPLEDDLDPRAEPLRLCPSDPDHRWVELRLRSDAVIGIEADGAVYVELRGPAGLFVQGDTGPEGGGIELAPVPVAGRYYVSLFAPEPRTYRLSLTTQEGGCPEGEFPCLHDDACISAERVCDDRSDCSDSTDELGCGFDCLSIEATCGDGSCIPRSWRCDGSPDCADGSDEASCGFVCRPGEMQCPGEQLCLHPDLVCNGEPDCRTSEADEDRCARDPNCEPAYPDVCIPLFPPDLDCGEIAERDFTVLAPDPHGLDFDRDGRGCEGEAP